MFLLKLIPITAKIIFKLQIDKIKKKSTYTFSYRTFKALTRIADKNIIILVRKTYLTWCTFSEDVYKLFFLLYALKKIFG